MTERDLRDRIHSVHERQVQSFHVLFTEGSWKTWAIFYVDEDAAALAIVSDFGNWSHVWGGPRAHRSGKTMLEFLRSASPHYIADKLLYGGRTREVANEKKTLSRMRSRVLEWRRAREIERDDAREMWDDIAAFAAEIADASGNSATVCHAIHCASDILAGKFGHGFGLYEEIVFSPAPKVTLLIEQLIPAFQKVLRGDVEQPAPHAEVQQ